MKLFIAIQVVNPTIRTARAGMALEVILKGFAQFRIYKINKNS
jgi:hypothetical protein